MMTIWGQKFSTYALITLGAVLALTACSPSRAPMRKMQLSVSAEPQTVTPAKRGEGVENGVAPKLVHPIELVEPAPVESNVAVEATVAVPMEEAAAPEAHSEAPVADPVDLPTAADGAAPGLSYAEKFSRTQSVLKYMGVPEERSSQQVLKSYAGRQTLSGLKAALPYLDPQGFFLKFFAQLTGRRLDAFQDFSSRKTPDFSVRLASSPSELALPEDGFHQRLLRARAANPSSKPLAGLRIAIDPGHMGGDFWDRQTGKRVHDSSGNWISEGVINLQVSLLLEKEFQNLGAEVLLTRRELKAVSPLNFARMDLKPSALRRLKESTLTPWFQQLLAAGPAGSAELYAAVDRSPKVQAFFADTRANRNEYYIRGEDLIARADAIESFNADIALVIHFDTSAPAADPSGVSPKPYNGTKAFVLGSYAKSELSSREQRLQFAKHLLDAASWNASLDLSSRVIGKIHDDLKVPYARGRYKQVKLGIYARDLGLSRRIADRAMSYVECLFYNDPNEFAALLKTTHPMQIGGVDYPYSDRLAQVADAIKDGVTEFVAHYNE